MGVIITTVSIDESDLGYLKQEGISRSEFLRQAIQAQKEKFWNYDRSKQK